MKYGEKYEGRKFQTVFVGPGKPPKGVVDEFRSVGKVLDGEGMTPKNAGNISVRTKRGMLITVGGVNKGKLTSGDVVEVMDFDFNTAKVEGKKEPSSETPMHWLIYHSYPIVEAVIHVHDDLAVDNADKLKLSAGIHSTKEVTKYGTADQAFEVIEALEHCQYAIVKNHGVVCMGSTLTEAMNLILNIHRLLKQPINPSQ
jgi:L-fuculose-phosphate aldolase